MSVRRRLREPVSSRRFLQLAVGAVVALGLVVTSGAFVRLTGSGLGCDNWPRCGSTPFPALSFHPMVEFGNRVVAVCGILASLATWHASRRVAGLPRWVVHVALAAFLGTVAQIPLGGITVILDLHPLAVMSHFLLRSSSSRSPSSSSSKRGATRVDWARPSPRAGCGWSRSRVSSPVPPWS